MSNDKSEKNVLAERDEEALAKLLQLAGPRSRIPEDIEQIRTLKSAGAVSVPVSKTFTQYLAAATETDSSAPGPTPTS
jgi:hypothetical protein